MAASLFVIGRQLFFLTVCRSVTKSEQDSGSMTSVIRGRCLAVRPLTGPLAESVYVPQIVFGAGRHHPGWRIALRNWDL